MRYTFSHSAFRSHARDSGGNLAAILTHKAALASPPIPLVFQVLFVPVTDNTADPAGTTYPSWRECANTVALVPGRMLWFRDYYLPNEADRAKWDNSPIFAPEEAFKKSPPALVVVAELDILRDEGIAYAEKLKQAGVEVELRLYKGCPHPVASMDGVSLRTILVAVSHAIYFSAVLLRVSTEGCIDDFLLSNDPN